MADTKTISIEVTLNEDEARTEARASVTVRDREFTAQGTARRNPSDPNVPVVGEELALARALSELSHGLVGAAADAIEQFEGHPVSLRS